MITTTYLQSDIINDGIPFLSPSNAPQQMTDTDEAINPILITFNAVIPFCIVTAFIVSHFIGAVGVWHAFWTSEVVTALISYLVYKKCVKL